MTKIKQPVAFTKHEIAIRGNRWQTLKPSLKKEHLTGGWLEVVDTILGVSTWSALIMPLYCGTSFNLWSDGNGGAYPVRSYTMSAGSSAFSPNSLGSSGISARAATPSGTAASLGETGWSSWVGLIQFASFILSFAVWHYGYEYAAHLYKARRKMELSGLAEETWHLSEEDTMLQKNRWIRLPNRFIPPALALFPLLGYGLISYDVWNRGCHIGPALQYALAGLLADVSWIGVRFYRMMGLKKAKKAAEASEKDVEAGGNVDHQGN